MGNWKRAWEDRKAVCFLQGGVGLKRKYHTLKEESKYGPTGELRLEPNGKKTNGWKEEEKSSGDTEKSESPGGLPKKKKASEETNQKIAMRSHEDIVTRSQLSGGGRVWR